jgi:hypothetical protein
MRILGERSIDVLTGRPARAVALVLAASMALGVLAPALLDNTFPHDLVEGFLWGRSFEFGYHKHPPLQAWLAGGVERLVPDSGRWLVFVLAQGCVGIAILAIWRLGVAIAGPVIGAVSAIGALAGLHPYTSPTHTLTPDTLSLPLWALALLAYWRVVGEGRAKYWYALALVAAAFVYAKYTGLLLFAVLGVLTLATSEGRRALRQKEAWAALALGVALVVPHLLWIRASEGSSIAHILNHDTRYPATSWWQRAALPLRFFAAQALSHSALLALFSLCFVPSRGDGRDRMPVERAEITRFAVVFLAVVTCAPLAFVLVFNFISGVQFRHAWAFPFFATSALCLLLMMGRAFVLRRMGLATCAVFSLIALEHVVPPMAAKLRAGDSSAARIYPSRALARELTNKFHEATGRPLRVVVGERIDAGQIAFYSPDRPFLYIDGSTRKSPWITPELIASSGALVVWFAAIGDKAPAAFTGEFAGLAAQGMVEKPFTGFVKGKSVALNYAVVPPRPATSP